MVFVYDARGKLIGEYSCLVQTGDDAKTVYTTNDHLGSPPITTDATGQVISRNDYLAKGSPTPATARYPRRRNIFGAYAFASERTHSRNLDK